MKFTPHPGYEAHLDNYRILAHGTQEEKAEAFAQQQKQLRAYALPKSLEAEDRTIQGPGGELLVRVIRPKNLREPVPMVLDIHGGGWVGGSVYIDDFRNSLLVEGIGCVVVAVEYRLAPRHPFPAALLDCQAALLWMVEHAEELGGDPARLGLHGTSAGGNIAAGLSLYLRDQGGPRLSLVALSCPVLTLERLTSFYQMERYALADLSDWAGSVENKYLGNMDGGLPSYYAFPAYCQALWGLPPTAIVAAEYDPLRDEAVDYARRLMAAEVPCELLVAPRVGHAYPVVDQPLTRWTMEGLSASFRREFALHEG